MKRTMHDRFGLLLLLSFALLHAVAADGMPSTPATFPVVTTTVYFYVDGAEYPDWCKAACGGIGSADPCKILESQRGFYEEVLCQGSGIKDGNIYRYNSIQPTKAASPTEKAPLTASGTIPQQHRTIAVNTKTPDCNITLGSNVYVFFAPGNPWNGWYVAEDVGGSIIGCHIDVFAGKGKMELQDARNYADGKLAKLWVYPADYPVPKTGQAGEFFGMFSYKPYVDLLVPYDLGAYGTLASFTTGLKSTCNNNLKSCVQTNIDAFTNLYSVSPDKGYVLSKHCSYNEYYSYIEELYDCMESPETDCVCPIKTDFSSVTYEKVTRIEYDTPDGSTSFFSTFDTSIPPMRFPFPLGYTSMFTPATVVDDIWWLNAADLTYVNLTINASGVILLAESAVTGILPVKVIPYKMQLPSGSSGLVFTRSTHNSLQCPIRKTHYPFCLNFTHQRNSVLARETDPLTKKTKTKTELVPTRFAVTLIDTVPPQQLTGVIAKDVPNMSKAIVLTWPARAAVSHPSVSDTDIAGYVIYLATEQFEGKTQTEIESLPSVQKIELDPYLIERADRLADILLGSLACDPVTQACTVRAIEPIPAPPDYITITVDIGALYAESDTADPLEGSFVHFIYLPTDATYYIGVYAVDDFGNVNYATHSGMNYVSVVSTPT